MLSTLLAVVISQPILRVHQVSSSLPDLVLIWGATRCMTSRTLGRTPWKGSCFLPGGNRQLPTPPIPTPMSQLINPSVPLTHHQNFGSRTKCHKLNSRKAQNFCSSHLTFVWPQERWHPQTFQPNPGFHWRKMQLPRAGATCVRK